SSTSTRDWASGVGSSASACCCSPAAYAGCSGRRRLAVAAGARSPSAGAPPHDGSRRDRHRCVRLLRSPAGRGRALTAAAGVAGDAGIIEACQEALEDLEVHRLGDVEVEPGVTRTAPIVLLAPAGQRDEDRPRPALALAQTARGLEAVELGKAEIEQHHLGLESLGS